MSDAAAIARALGGVPNGNNFLCHCPAPNHGKGRGDRNRSLSIRDGDQRLLVKCFAGCDPHDVLTELRRRGLIEGDHADRPAPRRISPPTAIPPEPALMTPDPAAVALWRSAVPIAATLAKSYLHHRGLVGLPPSLRFLPLLDYMPRIALPAMVAAVQAPDRRIIAVQVTFLDPRGDHKAQVATPRRTIGALGAGAVRLGPVGNVLGLAEGIETALSAQALSRVPCWACLGAGRMHRVAIPDSVRELHLFGDNDEPGRQAVERTAAPHRHRRVVIHYAPDDCKDFNDVLQQMAVPA